MSEELIREALHPYRGLLVATKAGLTRPGPGQWPPTGRPAYLIGQAKGSLRKLGVEQIALWQLHRIDPHLPRDEQFGAIRRLLDDGIIRNAGLSEVSVADIEAARRVFPVATVQNRYNLVDRQSEDVLAYCAANNIGFIPWFPLAAGELTRPGGYRRSHRRGAWRHGRAGRPRLAATAQPRHATDPRYAPGGSPNGSPRTSSPRSSARPLPSWQDARGAVPSEERRRGGA